MAISEPDPESLGLPISKWRSGQWDAIRNSVYSKKRFVAHNAPTGSGKSVLLVGEARYTGQRTLILTGAKALQKQYKDQFKSLGAVIVQGKANYTCRATELGGEFYDHSSPKSVDYGPCQFGIECGLKANGCTYYDTIRQAYTANLVVANYAAWIAANLYSDGWGYFPLVMLDEAHEAEGWLARMLAIHLPHTYETVIGVDFPSHTDPLKWAQWAAEWHPKIKYQLRKGMDEAKQRRGAAKHAIRLKALQVIERTLDRLRTITEDWMVFPQKDNILFHPVWVHKYAETYLFNGAKKVVLASATIRPHTLSLLGVGEGEYDFHDYPSTFPVKRRPIYYYPVVKMHHGMEAEETIEWVTAGDSFISQRLDRKGLIHTVSFARQKQVVANSQFASLMVANLNGATATTSLQKYRLASPPAILATPSMATGINLPYKECEWTWIPKIPFENIMDPMAIARAAEDPTHGIYQAGQTLVQSIGRAMRADDDQNESLITDANFNMFRSMYRNMIPKWVWDAVKKVDVLPMPLEALK